MSVQTLELAPATRVASRKLGPTRGSGWSSRASTRAAWDTSTFASTCGRWLTVASRRSWASASMASGRAPKPTSRRWRRSYSNPDEPSPGVRYQTAPWNRSARACSTPDVSAPAIGWPPMKRSSAADCTTLRLVEPTSLTTQSGPAAASACCSCAGSAPTGAQAKQASAPSSAPSSSARSRRSRLRPKPTTSASSACSFAARPMEPPIRPTPRTAILIPCRSSSVAPLADGGRQLVDDPDSLLPRHAGVGDRLAVGEPTAGVQLLAPRGDGRLEHHADDRAVAAQQLLREVGDHGRLPAVVLAAVVV